jgi:zinc transporter ZupT
MTYIITFFAVIIGYVLALFLKPKVNKNIKLFLSFSGAFLLGLVVTHLLPEMFHHHGHDHENCAHDHNHFLPVGAFILIGILFQIILEYFSKGAEHGHMHLHASEKKVSIPVTLFISLCLHALFEGFPIANNHQLAYGIGVHHLPIAMILTILFYQANISKIQVLLFMLAFASMTPIGIYLAEHMSWAQHYSQQLTGIAVGILLHISSTIIYESNENHKFNLAKLSIIVLGFVLAYLMSLGHSH